MFFLKYIIPIFSICNACTVVILIKYDGQMDMSKCQYLIILFVKHPKNCQTIYVNIFSQQNQRRAGIETTAI